MYSGSPSITRAPSQAGSPSLRTFGTFGSIQRSVAARGDEITPDTSTKAVADSELLISASPFNGLSSAAVPNLGAPNSVAEWDIPDYYGEFSLQAGQIASGWADGMYDFASAQARFDWMDTNLRYDAEFDFTCASSNGAGITF